MTCSWRRVGKTRGANAGAGPNARGCHRYRGPSACSTPGEQQRYIVREGDTLGIAARFGVSEDAILKENPSPIAIASSSGRNW